MNNVVIVELVALEKQKGVIIDAKLSVGEWITQVIYWNRNMWPLNIFRLYVYFLSTWKYLLCQIVSHCESL